VSSRFVPVALNLYKTREAKGDGGDLFRSVQKQTPEQYQGITIISPGGKVLANQATAPAGGGSWTDDLIERIDRGLAAFGPVEPRPPEAHEALPHRGAGDRPGGGVSLAVYTRLMLLGTLPEGLGSATVDTLPLDEPEFRTLGPAGVRPGEEWRVPEGVARKFNRLLSPASDQSTMPLPGEVTAAHLSGRVERVEGGVAYLTFGGRIAGEHAYKFAPHVGKRSRADARVVGVGTCDAAGGRLRSLTLVVDGVFRGLPPYDQPQPYGAVVEWDRDRTGP